MKLSSGHWVMLVLGVFFMMTGACLVLILKDKAPAAILTAPFGGLLLAGATAVGKRIGDAKGELPDFLTPDANGSVTVTKTSAPPPLVVPSKDEFMGRYSVVPDDEPVGTAASAPARETKR